jgi:hypothetical protein
VCYFVCTCIFFSVFRDVVREAENNTSRTEARNEEFTSWDITSRSPLKVNRSFGGTCRLRLQDRRKIEVRTRREAGSERSNRLAEISYYIGNRRETQDSESATIGSLVGQSEPPFPNGSPTGRSFCSTSEPTGTGFLPCVSLLFPI